MNSNVRRHSIKSELERNSFWSLRSWISNLELYTAVNTVLYLVEKKNKVKKKFKRFYLTSSVSLRCKSLSILANKQ